jgi:Trypsin
LFFIFSVPDPYATFWILGMHDQRTRDGTVYSIEHYMLHPQFTNYTVYDDFDMALVTVQGKISFSFDVKPICLTNGYDDYVGKKVIVAG